MALYTNNEGGEDLFGLDFNMKWINFLIKKGEIDNMTDDITDLQLYLEDYRKSEKYKWIVRGYEYYHNQNPINSATDVEISTRRITSPVKFTSNGSMEAGGEDEVILHGRPVKSQYSVSHPIMMDVVDEKVDYIFATPFTVTSDNEDHQEKLTAIFNAKVRNLCKEWLRETINSGEGWMNFSFKDGKIEFRLIPTAQLYPEYENDVLVRMSHFYTKKVIINGTVTLQECLDVYDRSYKRSYVKDCLTYIPEGEIRPLLEVDGVVMELDTPPFVSCERNYFKEPLVLYLHSLIDDCDFVKSQSSKAISKLTDTLLILKKAGGTDLQKVIHDFQKYGILKTNGEAEVDAIYNKLNTSDLLEHIRDTKKSITKYAKSVDIESIDTLNLSGVSIKLLYTALNADCHNLISNLQEALQELVKYINLTLVLNGKDKNTIGKVEFIFTTSKVFNESEEMQMLMTMYDKDLISKHSILSQSPFIKDVDIELTKIEEEKNNGILNS